MCASTTWLGLAGKVERVSQLEGKREEGEMEGRREGWREGKRKRWTDGGREGGKEMEGEMEGGREREGGRFTIYIYQPLMFNWFS